MITWPNVSGWSSPIFITRELQGVRHDKSIFNLWNRGCRLATLPPGTNSWRWKSRALLVSLLNLNQTVSIAWCFDTVYPSTPFSQLSQVYRCVWQVCLHFPANSKLRMGALQSFVCKRGSPEYRLYQRCSIVLSPNDVKFGKLPSMSAVSMATGTKFITVSKIGENALNKERQSPNWLFLGRTYIIGQ